MRHRRRMLRRQCDDFRLFCRQRRRLHAVGLGQHDLVDHGGLVEQLHHRVVGVLYLHARVQQQQHAAQVGAAAQVVQHQPLPVALDGFRRLGVAVAGHVHEHERGGFQLEEVKLAGAAWLVRDAGQRLAPGERVQQRGFADVGAAGERDFGAARLRQMFERLGGVEEVALAGKQFPASLDLRGR